VADHCDVIVLMLYALTLACEVIIVWKLGAHLHRAQAERVDVWTAGSL
jgi:hypothetical protein